MRTSTAAYTAAVASGVTEPTAQVLFAWPAKLNPTLARTNECPSPNAGHGVGLWQPDPNGTTVTPATSPVVLPSGNTLAFQIVWGPGAAGTCYAQCLNLITIPGVTYTLSGQLYAQLGGVAVQLSAVGTSGATSSSAATTSLNNLFALSVTFTAVDTATSIRITNAVTATAGQKALFGDVLFEQSGTAGPFFDGDSPSSSWTGFLAGSISVQQQAPYNDLSAAFKSSTGQASITTDMPVSTRLVEGYPVRTHTLILAGRLATNQDETVSAQWLFDQLSDTSPLYRLDWTGVNGVTVTLNEGLMLPTFNSPERYTVFTGTVDTLSIDRLNGTVTLNLIVARWSMSGIPQLPAAISVTPWAPASTPNPLIAPGLTALWPLDYILRSAGIYSSPPPRPNCYAYLSMHGSVWPEVSGPMTFNNTQLYGDWPAGQSVQPVIPVWQPGRYVGQVPVRATAVFPLTQSLQQSGGTKLTMEVWFNSVTGSTAGQTHCTVGDNSFANSAIELSVNNIAGQIQCLSTTSRALTPTVIGLTGVGFTSSGLTPGWHQVTACYTFSSSTAVAVTYYIDGQILGIERSAGLANPAVLPMTSIYVYTDSGGIGVASDTWQVFGDPVQLPTPQIVPGAILDGSLNNLTAIPALTTGTDDWKVIQEMCDAEGAVAGFDETNVFRFRNRNNVYGTVSQATVTSLTQIKQLTIDTAESTRARTVTANCFPLAVGIPSVVWNATQTYVVPAYGSLTIFATLPVPAVFVPAGFSIIPGGGITDFTLNGWRAAFASDGSGGQPAGVSLFATALSSTTVKIVGTNPNSRPVYLVSPSGAGFPVSSNGKPVLELVGIPISPATPIDTTGLGTTGTVAVRSVYGTGLPALALPDSAWRQDQAATQAFTDATLIDLYRPRPIIPVLTITGDSRLQLGDRVTVQDLGDYITNGHGAAATLNDDIILTSINPVIDSPSGFTQTCVGRFATRPGSWVLGVAGRSELGVTTNV